MKVQGISVKQAEKWLEKLKNSDFNSYKEVIKELKKFERREDKYDSFIKINKTLLHHPDLTTELNTYLQEGNKFVINQNPIDRINSLMKHIKKTNPEIYNRISSTIRSIPQDDSAGEICDQNLKKFVIESVRGNEELELYADRMFNFEAEDRINKLDLPHLKSYRLPPEEIPEEEIRGPKPVKKPKLHIETVPQKFLIPARRLYPLPPFTSPIDQKTFLQALEKKIGKDNFKELTKIIHLYSLNIISRNQTMEVIKKFSLSDEQNQSLADIVEPRETDRRRSSKFKPLIDFDYQSSQRGTHSYVSMPSSYPILSSTRTDDLKKILNDKWISIPRGSQDFNVRFKNQHEQNLLKAEDQRYQFDLYLMRLKKVKQIVVSMIDRLSLDRSCNVEKEVKTVISMGIIQIMYKNGSKQQKEEIQWFFKTNPLETAKILQFKSSQYLKQLKNIKQVHGIRNWIDIANKNWAKSQDFKGFAFKKNQKDKMKSNIFLNELNLRLRYLECRGEIKNQDTPFEDKKEFFSIFNSFESSSRKEKCMKRILPKSANFDIKHTKIPSLLPVIIMAFEDQEACLKAYSFIVYYLENSGVTEGEKNRCRQFLKNIMSRFFKLKRLPVRYLSKHFDEDTFYNKITGEEDKTLNFDGWIIEESEREAELTQKNEKIPKLNILDDQKSQFSYQPPKTKENTVFFSSQNFYVFVRFFYALYERIIRMKEVAQNEEKAKFFEILYYSCIKTKESAKFEDCLNCLFKSQSHIFSTIYKLIENLTKSLNLVSICNITNQSMKFINTESQQVYILLLNRYYLNNTFNSKILRFTLEHESKLLYINSLESYYKCEEQGKDLNKKRGQITRDIELYTIEGFDEGYKENQAVVKNGFEYSFEGNTIKMLNLYRGEDLIKHSSASVTEDKLQLQVTKAVNFWKNCH